MNILFDYKKIYSACALLLITVLPCHSSWAVGIAIKVTNQSGEGSKHTVVSLHPTQTGSLTAATGSTAEMDQLERQYTPFILPIQIGTKVIFPNWDRIKHHVYSFSTAKRFELKLYSGKSAPPVTFDKTGEIALGCNIHDWMLGYIYVLDTPYFAKTDSSGEVTIEDVPVGKYQLQVWHPGLKGKIGDYSRDISISADSNEMYTLSINTKPVQQPEAPEQVSPY